MCGICGIFGESDKSALKKMLEAIKHRGPDGEGFYYSPEVSLGVCCLNIVDSKNGNQPIFNETHKACIVFNGEIYNHVALRETLVKKGHHFSSKTDSEVVLHLFEEYGESCVDYLEGMFAFAIWDGEKLFLARDRMGIKPLFYAHLPESRQLVFGSEIKSVLQHSQVREEADEKALCELQVLGFILSPDSTPQKYLKQLRPGSTLTAILSTNSINLDERIYFVIESTSVEGSFENRNLEEETITAKLEALLRESCRAIVRHDNLSKATYLSGGLDSTLLTILCAEESSSPIHTFTLADSRESEDLRYARKVAKAIGSIHHEILVDESEYIEEYPKFLEAYENIPSSGTFDIDGDFAFFLVSKHISKFVRVAICGEGADELFGGYWMHRWPLGYTDRIFDRLSTLDLNDNALDLTSRLRKWFPKEENKEVYRRGVFDILLKGGLSNYHLWAVDRTSMWHGLEVRVPYLHDKVVKWVNSLPLSFRVKDGTTKLILRNVARKIFARYLLNEILERPKQAMPDALENLNQTLGPLNIKNSKVC
jgi:asparagine synthase (glutamine-hydrolysing)